KNIDELEKALVSFEKENSEIESGISHVIGDFIMWKTISDSRIPDDNNEATISSYGEVNEIQLNLEELTHYGDGKFGIHFCLEMEVYVTYYIYKPDYYMLREGSGHTLSISDHNDHYFEAEEDFNINVIGTAAFTIDSDSFDLADISESIINGTLEIDEVSAIELC
ncbi:MAG: hypothetical protein V7695_25120, partial [Sulfitobacter sp.]